MATVERQETKWKQGAVTFLDCLGWKGAWRRLRDPIRNISRLRQLATEVEHLIKHVSEGGAGWGSRFRDLETSYTAISDTIALETAGDMALSVELHARISAELLPRSLRLGLPIRGATSFGQYIWAGNAMMGPAVDEVASWYEAAEWIGVFLTPSILLKRRCAEIRSSAPVVDYDVPLKAHGPLTTLGVDWLPSKATAFYLATLERQFEKMSPLTPDIAWKYLNTKRFIDHVLSLPAASRHPKPEW